MSDYTAHLKLGRAPVLVKEAFSLGAFLFGPLWLAAQNAWIPAVLLAALMVALGTLLSPGVSGVVLLGVAWLAGLLGRDLVRWSLDRRGYVLAHVVAARDEDAALGRLLSYRPDVAAGMAGPLR